MKMKNIQNMAVPTTLKKPSQDSVTSKIRPKSCRGQYVFLTIPHFDQLETTYQILELKSEELFIRKFAVVLETHTNDPNKGNHIHVFVEFTKRRDIGLKFFDFIGKHGKLEPVRSIHAVLQYMNKENVCKSNFDVWLPLLNSVKTFTRTIIKMQEHGWTEDQILIDYAGCVDGNKPWKTALNLSVERATAKVEKENNSSLSRMREITPELISKRLSSDERKIFYANPNFQKLIDFINKLLKYGNMHPYKECCVAIVGNPSIGKSTVIRALSKHFITYNFPLDGWHAKYVNYVNELIVWNEWDIRLISRSDLLLFTEGEIVDLKVKYTKAIKKDRPLIIFTSNDSWQKQVHRRYAYDPTQRDTVLGALAVRIVELDFGNQKIWFLTKLFVPNTNDITEK